MGKMLQMIEQWIGGGPGAGKRLSTFRWLIIIGLAGLALMILNSFLTVKEVDPIGEGRASPPPVQQTFLGSESKESTAFHEYETAYQSAIKEILQKVVGVGDVEVLVTIESTEEIIVKENQRDAQQVTQERDQHGATRHTTDITRSGEVVLYQRSGDQTPIVLKKIKPKIRGVVIVAKGAENLTVKKMVSEAVARGLDVPPHRISILPRKQ